jgi:CIC family chloride channel protein
MVGMAGILSGLFHAPLTAIFLIGEITGGYDLMVPLMMVSSISFAVSRKFEKHSMDVKALADKGEVFTGDKDKNVLLGIDFLSQVQTQTRTFQRTDTVEAVLEALQTSKQTLFAVVDEKQRVLGMLDFQHLKTFIFNSYRVKFGSIEEWMQPVDTVLHHDDGMELIMEKFEQSQRPTLLVLKSGKYYGLVDKCALLETYRSTLKGLVIE